MLFGEGQGSKYEVSVVTLDEVKVFDSEEEASVYGEKILDNGGDSYFVYKGGENINWCGNKRKFNRLKKLIEYESNTNNS